MTAKLEGVKLDYELSRRSTISLTSLLLVAGTTCGSLRRRLVFSSDMLDMFADELFIAGFIEFSSSVESSRVDIREGGRNLGENTFERVLPCRDGRRKISSVSALPCMRIRLRMSSSAVNKIFREVNI